MSIRPRQTKTKNTVWDSRLRDPSGREISRTFSSRAEAKAYEATDLSSRLASAWVDPRKSKATFADRATIWVASNPNKKPKTVHSDESALRLHILPTIGHLRVNRITRTEIQDLVSAWSAEFAPSTVHRHYAVMKAIFSHTQEDGLIGRSPCGKRLIKLPDIVRRERHQLSAEDVQALADAVGPDYRAAVYIGAVLGLRIGEVVGLRVKDFNLADHRVSVVRGVSEVSGQLFIGAPKSRAGVRTMRMPPVLTAEVAEHLELQGLGGDGDAYVFSDRNGGPVRQSNFYSRTWVPARTSLGLVGVGFHDLRRAFATTMAKEGVDTKTAQVRMGHASAAMYLGYVSVTTVGDDYAAEKLGAHFMGEKQVTPQAAAG